MSIPTLEERLAAHIERSRASLTVMIERAAAARNITVPEYQRLRTQWQLRDIEREIAMQEIHLRDAPHFAVKDCKEKLGRLREEQATLTALLGEPPPRTATRGPQEGDVS